MYLSRMQRISTSKKRKKLLIEMGDDNKNKEYRNVGTMELKVN
jgi:hypothetical protein